MWKKSCLNFQAWEPWLKFWMKNYRKLFDKYDYQNFWGRFWMKNYMPMLDEYHYQTFSNGKWTGSTFDMYNEKLKPFY